MQLFGPKNWEIHLGAPKNPVNYRQHTGIAKEFYYLQFINNLLPAPIVFLRWWAPMLSNNKGYSILEIVITISLICIIFITYNSSWQAWISNNRAWAASNQIVAALQMARSEAITRSEPVTFCQSSDQRSCGGDWNDGQIIITGANQVLRTFAAIDPQDRLTWKSSFGHNMAVTFLPSGHTNGEQGTFVYYPRQHPESAQSIIIEHTGRIRIAAHH